MAPRRVAKPHLARSHSRSSKAGALPLGIQRASLNKRKGGPAWPQSPKCLMEGGSCRSRWWQRATSCSFVATCSMCWGVLKPEGGGGWLASSLVASQALS